MGISSEMKKVLLAGVGAVATTVEKSSEVVDTLIKKGELTVEQGKILNEELKRSVQKSAQKTKNEFSFLDELEKLSESEIEQIKLKLAEMEKEKNAEEGKVQTDN
ncbi:MAG: phasin family protein [Bacillus sp. (in: firmicutes)]